MLADLDELVLRCRDERAKSYISEALACYKSGANRAAIIATWIAVTFDIIDKLRELALAGDAAATEVIDEFDAITAANDVSRAQRFERQLLTVAKDKLELISAQECVDLERLQADRHRCAHPSQSGAGEIFAPTAELARFHIRSAVEHLLQHEPAQGKAALEGLLRTIDSEYFTTDVPKALVILGKSPLRRARPSLVRNLTLVLLKSFFKEQDVTFVWRRRAAFNCVRILHPAQWLQTVEKSLTPLVRACSTPDELIRAAQLLDVHSDVGRALEDDQVLRLSGFITNLPTDMIIYLGSLIGDGPLSEAVKVRISCLTTGEIAEIAGFEFELPSPVIDRLVSRYIRASSFDDANEWGKLVHPNISAFSEAQLVTVLRGALANDQIQGSFQLPHVVTAIKRRKEAKQRQVADLVAELEAKL